MDRGETTNVEKSSFSLLLLQPTEMKFVGLGSNLSISNYSICTSCSHEVIPVLPSPVPGLVEHLRADFLVLVCML